MTTQSPPWILRRFGYFPDCTLGELFIPEFHADVYTIERPWLSNQRYISCIPTGEYPLVHHSGTRWPSAIRLVNVPGRSAILIHSSLTVKGVKGCIAVGNGIIYHNYPNFQLTRSPETFQMVLERFETLREPPVLFIEDSSSKGT